jgi:hypothetical protein
MPDRPGGGRVRALDRQLVGLAPSPRAKQKPGAPFDASDSKTYPVDGFRRLDTAVRAAAASGLGVQMDLAFWAPRWACEGLGPQRPRARARSGSRPTTATRPTA